MEPVVMRSLAVVEQPASASTTRIAALACRIRLLRGVEAETGIARS
jgi:hypothetical protein